MPDDKLQRIVFLPGTQGAKLFTDEQDRLILVGGAVTTRGRFARFDESLCHVCDDNVIRRNGRVIGTRADFILLADDD